ncbi:hypothetical protein D3C75_805550 [compost metagenome]
MQLVHNLLLALQYLGEMNGHFPRGDAEAFGFPHGMGQLRAPQQRLGGNTPPVQAGAAQLVPLHNSYGFAQLGRPDGRYVPACPASQHHYIILLRHQQSLLYIPNMFMNLRESPYKSCVSPHFRIN